MWNKNYMNHQTWVQFWNQEVYEQKKHDIGCLQSKLEQENKFGLGVYKNTLITKGDF